MEELSLDISKVCNLRETNFFLSFFYSKGHKKTRHKPGFLYNRLISSRLFAYNFKINFCYVSVTEVDRSLIST
jgi:hypothetical protein